MCLYSVLFPKDNLYVDSLQPTVGEDVVIVFVFLNS